MDIKVSIIIPVYNVAPFLDKCLSSCIDQTFQDIEIIVVNDGSRDGSSQIIAAYAAIDDRIRIITKENQGLIYARKSGLEVASGKYVFHLDGDDYIETTAIEELYSEAVKSEADYVVGNFYLVSENNKQKGKSICELNALVGQELLLRMINRGEWRIWGSLIQKSLFDDLIYLPVVMGEDLFFNMQICLKVKKSTVVDICLYNYVIRTGSITNQEGTVNRKLKLAMAKYVHLLLDGYAYIQPIRECLYLMFCSFFQDSIKQKDMEVKTILYDYYWNNKEVKAFLWRRKKAFYLIIRVFLVYPYMGSLMVKTGSHMTFLWRKFKIPFQWIFRKRYLAELIR